MASEHTFSPAEKDTKLLLAWTPPGNCPPYVNATMLRIRGDVVLTVRMPGVAGLPGATSSVRFTREMWREFAKAFDGANRVFEACDDLDSIL